MWFKLAGADFSKNNLGTMSSISSSYLINYSKLTGMSGTPTSVSYAGSSAGTAKTVEVTITVTSGYSFKNGSKITASGGKTGTVFTADKDYAGGSTFKFSMSVTGNVELTGAAEAVSTGGGNTSGGGNPPPVSPDLPDISTNLITAGTLYERSVTSSTTDNTLMANSTYFTYENIPVSANTTYIAPSGRRTFFLDSSKTLAQRDALNIYNLSPQCIFTTPSNCAYVTISFKYEDIQPDEASLTVYSG